jgi:hypothetical protein
MTIIGRLKSREKSLKVAARIVGNLLAMILGGTPLVVFLKNNTPPRGRSDGVTAVYCW